MMSSTKSPLKSPFFQRGKTHTEAGCDVSSINSRFRKMPPRRSPDAPTTDRHGPATPSGCLAARIDDVTHRLNVLTRPGRDRTQRHQKTA